MKGIIMAGGEGTRLRPLTCGLPKPMVPIMDKPIMSYSIELFKKYNIRNIGVTLQYLPDSIQEYYKDGADFGVNLKYFIEETPLGTAGSVKNCQGFLDETFIVISGDALTCINLNEAIKFHKDKKSTATLVLKKVEIPLEFGVVVTNEYGEITRFLEKPNWDEVFSDTVNTGIYILEPEVLDYLESEKKYDFSKDLFPMLLHEEKPVYGYITSEYWCDIGNSETYMQAQFDMLSGGINMEIPGKKIGENIWAGKNVEIAKDALIEGPCYIGNFTTIGKSAYVGPFSIIGSHCTIGQDTSIKRSVVWNNVLLGRKDEIRGATLCNKVRVCDNVSVFEGAIIGESCYLKNSSIVRPQVKIWPHKIIEKGTAVNSNLVWGTKAKKALFGSDGISGTLNMDLLPENISKLGAVFGAITGLNKRIAVSCDNTPSNTMIKHGLVSGLLSTGIEVFDLGYLSTPALRYAVNQLALDGGIHVYSYEEKPQEAYIVFVDDLACNLSPSLERKIENFYMSNDFQRQNSEGIHKVHVISDINIFYARSILEKVKFNKIKEHEPNIVICTLNSLSGDELLSNILESISCHITVCRSSEELQEKLEINNYDLGCIIDPNNEVITLYDEDGKLIRKEVYIALLNLLNLKCNSDEAIIVPYNATNAFEQLASKFNSKVIRTKTTKQALMKETHGYGLFNLYFDVNFALLKILETVSIQNISLSRLIKEIPDFYMSEKEITCPWSLKSIVVSSLIEAENMSENKVELYEGVKIINDKGWTLILPDSYEPVCKIYSEGFNEEYAEEISAIYEKKILDIQKENKVF